MIIFHLEFLFSNGFLFFLLLLLRIIIIIRLTDSLFLHRICIGPFLHWDCWDWLCYCCRWVRSMILIVRSLKYYYSFSFFKIKMYYYFYLFVLIYYWFQLDCFIIDLIRIVWFLNSLISISNSILLIEIVPSTWSHYSTYIINFILLIFFIFWIQIYYYFDLFVLIYYWFQLDCFVMDFIRIVWFLNSLISISNSILLIEITPSTWSHYSISIASLDNSRPTSSQNVPYRFKKVTRHTESGCYYILIFKKKKNVHYYIIM